MINNPANESQLVADGFFATAQSLTPSGQLLAFKLVRERIDESVQSMRRALVEQQSMIDSLLPEPSSKPVTATPTAAKYRNPNGDQVWSGIGRRPEWFLHAINAGVDPADMEIAG